MHELLSTNDLEGIFKPIYYTCIPIEYIANVSVKYHDGSTKRYTKHQIENQIRNGRDDGYAKIIDLYNDEWVEQTEINIDFKKLTNHINHTLVKTLHNYSMLKKRDV